MNVGGYTGTPDDDFGQQIGGTGGDNPHSHTIASQVDHTHDITLPKRYVVGWFRRTA